jgi:hypothetical protein
MTPLRFIGMRKPLPVAVSALALFAASTRPSHAETSRAETAHAETAHAEMPHAETAHAAEVSQATDELLPERFRLGERDSLVVSVVEKTASVAVCIADDENRAWSAPDPLELARRGGTEREERGRTVSSWCTTLPASEIAFAVWLAGHLRSPELPEDRPPRPGAAAEIDAERAALSLALEGASIEDPPPPRRAIAITGNLRVAEVSGLVARYLGVVSPTNTARPPSWSFHQTSERLSVIEGSTMTPEIHYGWMAAGADADETATLRVAFEILAGSDASRLPRLLLPRGLARHVGAWSISEARGMLLGVVVETVPRTSVDRVRRFIDGSIKQLRLVGPSEREVARAVAVLRRRAFETWEDPEARARVLAEYELVTGDARQFSYEVGSLTHMKAEHVRGRAHEVLIDARRTTIETYPALWPADDPALARHQLYTVVAGDTLGTIAARFHADPARVAKDNDLDPRYRLMPGQPLWIAPATPVAP